MQVCIRVYTYIGVRIRVYTHSGVYGIHTQMEGSICVYIGVCIRVYTRI